MSAPFSSDLATAPTGRIAWVFMVKGVRNLWVADPPDFRARQVTHYSEDGIPLASVRLTPDGKTILYARGSETNRQGEVANPNSVTTQPHQQVFAVDVAGGEPRLLGAMECGSEGCENIQVSPDGKWAVWSARNNLWIAPVQPSPDANAAPNRGPQSSDQKNPGPAKQLAYVRGNNRDPHWSPDSRKIAFTSARGDHNFIVIYELGGDRVRYIAPSVDHDIYPRWSADGMQLAFLRLPGGRQEMPLIPDRVTPWAIWIANPGSGEAKQIWHSGSDADSSFPGMVAEDSFQFAGDHITFASEQDGWAHLYSVPVSGGKETLLTPGNFEIEQVALSQDQKSLLYSSNQDDIDRRHLWRVAVAGGKPTRLTNGTGIEWSPLETGDGKFVVGIASTATQPGLPFYLSNGVPQIIAREALPANWPAAQLVTPEPVIFKSEDGLTIHGQLFRPRNAPAKAPALVFVHGGSMRQMMLGFHNMYYYANAYAENQYLASLGYVVLSVNYRTGIMYGRAFREAPHTGPKGGYEYRDVAAAGRYLQAQPFVDKSKIGLWGGSYGGYLTAMGLAHNSDIFAAGVDMHGVHNWWTERVGPGTYVDAPDAAQARQLAWESSPDSAISKWTSPVLLIQGDDDRNVAFSQTVDLAQRLREQKVPLETIVFPDEIHDFLLWHNWVRAYDATARFFDRVLKNGEKIPVPQ